MSKSLTTEEHHGAAASKSSSSKRVEHRRSVKNAGSNVDTEAEKWPYCIVWTPLPFVTWFVPMIGHTGIADSKGIIYDFSDDFNVSVDNFSFGNPTKHYQFQPSLIASGASGWDRAIRETSDYYSHTRHSLFYNNCHQYIAGVLNKVHYDNRDDWTQTDVWCKITFKSSYVNFFGFVRQWWPFTIIVVATIILLVVIF